MIRVILPWNPLPRMIFLSRRAARMSPFAASGAVRRRSWIRIVLSAVGAGRAGLLLCGLWLCGLSLWGLLAPAVQAAAPPALPLLRLEAGMHVNLARAVAVDAAGQWAVTVSDDKTARSWRLPDGAAGPVLRPPIAEGGALAAEGRLQAVAIAPDASTVAVAGRSGAGFDGRNAVYVFERASGRMLRRIDVGSALPVVTLALTPDGRTLAVGLGDDGGLKTFDYASGRPIAHDADYAGSLYALDFRADGRVLAAGAIDGRLRVYNVDGGRLTLAGVARPQGGRQIAQVRFSPDGQLIALGLEDSPQVLVLDGQSLQLVGRPAPAADGQSVFSSLAWSPDGQELWGGGTHREGGRWQLRVWPRKDWQQFADRPVAGASVLALATLPGQRVLYLSGEPAWGFVDPAGQVQPRGHSPLASFNSLARQFQVSEDGRAVRFWFGFREAMHEFDLASRVLRAVPADGAAPSAGTPPATFAPPRLQADDGRTVDGWENQRQPQYGGQPLPIGELETARSLAFSADGRRFALGTDAKLWLFDAASGQPVWQVRAPALVWAARITAGGELLVTAGQDGVIRWYRGRDGAELLALFPHADRKRWVLWTPGGQFDAAPGAEELLGWHLNRGLDAAADFHPMWTLRERFRRADVIDRVLALRDLAQAVQQADAAAGKTGAPAADAATLSASLPPLLQLEGAAPAVTPAADGQGGEARLVLRLRSDARAPVSGLRARADGRPARIETVGAPRPVAGEPGSELREVRVQFAGRPQQLQLLADNRHGTSAAMTVRIPWGTAAAMATAAPPTGAGAAAGTPPAAAPKSGSAVTAAAGVAGTVAAGTVAAAATTAGTAAAAATGAAAATTAQAAGTLAQVATSPAAALAAASAQGLRKPRLYVLAIGVGQFRSADVPALNLPAKDATDFTAAMKRQEGRLYRSVETRLLTDAQGTREAIAKGMEWLQREVTQHDVGMLFVAGHGMNDPQAGYVFITHDFDFAKVGASAISHKQFKSATENLAGKALFFIDTCHSANVLGAGKKPQQPDVSAVINDLASDDAGVVVFSASTGRQQALENPAWGNGAFTKSLVEGLSGKADEARTGRITFRMLDYYITDRVKQLTQGRQSAVTVAPQGVPDFALAIQP
ncbi:MAG: hypothetical protein RLY78_545 [Pseudomonadota bacterium]